MSSDRAKHWAWSQMDLSRSELLLLLAMADNVGENLMCYAAVSTLGDMARMSERTVQRTLDQLRDLGKLSRVDRSGRTTLFQLLVPTDFGRRTGSRKARSTPDRMTGVGHGPGTEATGDTVAGVTGDILAGVTDCHGPPSKWRGTPANLAPNSSLDSSLHNPSSSPNARTPDARAGRARRDEDRDLFLLNNRARTLEISTRLPNETIDDFRKRISDADTAELQRRADAAAAARSQRDADQPPAANPQQPGERAA